MSDLFKLTNWLVGVSVEIKFKMDWQGCKNVYIFQILHLIGQWDCVKTLFNTVLINSTNQLGAKF